VDALAELRRLTQETARGDLPALLGQVVEAEASIRLRLAEAPAATPAAASRSLSVDEAAAVAGVSRRWILANTRGMKFRNQLSRKVVKFDEAGLRAWVAGRRR
jgi:hypothetical protein